MKRNERTSKKVAAIAGRILASDGRRSNVLLWTGDSPSYVKWAEIRMLAASALTQTAPKAKKKVSAWRYRKRTVVKKGKRK